MHTVPLYLLLLLPRPHAEEVPMSVENMVTLNNFWQSPKHNNLNYAESTGEEFDASKLDSIIFRNTLKNQKISLKTNSISVNL